MISRSCEHIARQDDRCASISRVRVGVTELPPRLSKLQLQADDDARHQWSEDSNPRLKDGIGTPSSTRLQYRSRNVNRADHWLCHSHGRRQPGPNLRRPEGRSAVRCFRRLRSRPGRQQCPHPRTLQWPSFALRSGQCRRHRRHRPSQASCRDRRHPPTLPRPLRLASYHINIARRELLLAHAIATTKGVGKIEGCTDRKHSMEPIAAYGVHTRDIDRRCGRPSVRDIH